MAILFRDLQNMQLVFGEFISCWPGRERGKVAMYASRSLQDKARLARQLANNMRQRGSDAAAVDYETKAQADDAHVDMMKRIVANNAVINQAA